MGARFNKYFKWILFGSVIGVATLCGTYGWGRLSQNTLIDSAAQSFVARNADQQSSAALTDCPDVGCQASVMNASSNAGYAQVPSPYPVPVILSGEAVPQLNSDGKDSALMPSSLPVNNSKSSISFFQSGQTAIPQMPLNVGGPLVGQFGGADSFPSSRGHHALRNHDLLPTLETPPVNSAPQLKIKAKGTLLNGVGPSVSIYLDGQLLRTLTVNNDTFLDITIGATLDPEKIKAGKKIDLFFSNDEYYGPGQDRNLIVESITVFNGSTTVIYKSAVVGLYDKGNTYEKATDGEDTLIGKEGMAENGAMRFVLIDGSNSPDGLSSVAPKPVPNPTDNILLPGVVSWSRVVTAWDKSENYDYFGVGKFGRLNNYWNAKPKWGYGPWFQQVGISSNQDGSVNCHIKWSFSSRAVEGDVENISYPECFVGLTSSAKTADTYFPRKISEIRRLTSFYSGIVGTTSGKGHVTYDMWLIERPDSMKNANRRVEIMLPVKPLEGYGLNRSTQKLIDSKVNISNKIYDVYYYNSNNPSLVVFQPVTPLGNAGGAIDWRPILDYLQHKKIIKADYYIAGIELGVETAINPLREWQTPVPTIGDIVIKNFNYTAN